MARLAGHALWFEGAAHDDEGHRINYGDRSTGRAKCECGDLSEVLTSNGQRKRWHAAHKESEQAAAKARTD